VNQIPAIVYVAPVITIAVAIYMVLNRGRAAKNMDAQWSQYRASELATRLGLQLVKGDPGFNFFIKQANADVARGPSDGKPIHIDVALEGEDTSLTYLYRVEQDTGFTRVTWKIWSDCRMTVRAPKTFTPFEVISKSAPLGPIARTQAFAAQQTGNPTIDATYAVYTTDAALAQRLAGELTGFSTFVNSGVHLVGDGESVSFEMKQDKAPLLANALYYAEDMQRLLIKLARAL
jgi:hypothetical protein